MLQLVCLCIRVSIELLVFFCFLKSFVLLVMKDIITDQRQISFHQFLTEYLPKAKLIVINPKTLVAVAYDEFRNVQCEFTFPSAAALDAALLEAAGGDVRKTPNVIVRSDDLTSQLLINLLPSVLIVGALLYSARLMGGTARKIFATGTTNSRVAPEHVTVRFSDVAGLDEAKREITEFVEFLRRPAKFRRLGARIPRGALLVGPPGTGIANVLKSICSILNLKPKVKHCWRKQQLVKHRCHFSGKLQTVLSVESKIAL